MGLLHILLAEKEGRIWSSIKCLKLYQFKRIILWCLFVLQVALRYVMLEKNILKNHGIMELVLGPPLGGGYNKIFGRP